MSKVVEFLKETKAELKQVTWPTKNQTIAFTALVIAISIVVAYFLGFFDLIFTTGLEKLLQ
jgi:preprotein translocase subunit SecE